MTTPRVSLKDRPEYRIAIAILTPLPDGRKQFVAELRLLAYRHNEPGESEVIEKFYNPIAWYAKPFDSSAEATTAAIDEGRRRGWRLTV